MVNESSRRGSLYFLLLMAVTIITPRNLMSFNYLFFTLYLGIYVVIWWKILRYMWLYNIEDDPRQWVDFLVYDLIYMIGLPVIIHLIAFWVGESLWRDGMYNLVVQIAYYGMLLFTVFLKFVLMRSRFQFFYRYVITLLFILGNAIILNQIYTIWYGLNYMGQGF
jgi:hypothetical protein